MSRIDEVVRIAEEREKLRLAVVEFDKQNPGYQEIGLLSGPQCKLVSHAGVAYFVLHGHNISLGNARGLMAWWLELGLEPDEKEIVR